MFKDDRMMSMLTFVMVMLVLGTVIQRSDLVERFLGDGPAKLELRSDEMIVRANELTAIDVLGNDSGVTSGDRDRLQITQQPACGRVFVREGKAHYLPAERCAGPQRFRYAVSGREGPDGEVIAVVRLDDPAQSKVTADAQRDFTAPAPGATRPAILRGGADPSVLADQAESAAAVSAAPTVPRPQAGQAAGLATPSGVPARAGDTNLALDGAGPAPRIADPGAGLGPGAPIPESAAPPVAPDQTAGAGPAPGADSAPAVTEGPQASAGAAAPPTGTGMGANLSGGGSPDSGSGVTVQRPTDGQDGGVARAAPATIGAAAAPGPDTDPPMAALQPLLQGSAPTPAGLAPVDTTPPPPLADPLSGGAATPQAPLPPAAAQPAAPAQPCAVPPALTLDIRPGGQTVVGLDAPCDAGQVARLGYDTLEFGIALDAAGKGSVTVPGLQPSSDAELRLPSGDGLAFELPFADTARTDRVAMAWEAPVRLDLHAFEFGAPPGSAGHVRPDRPRSFEDVRSRGGGYLLTYAPVGGVGQNISVYTWWRRPGGGAGVVKLMVDFASRSGGGQPEACGAGVLAQPGFRVLRSLAGRLAPPGLRRLASLDCASVARAERLIADAVDDMVILRR